MDNKNQLNDKKLNDVNGGAGIPNLFDVMDKAQALLNQIDSRGYATEEENTRLWQLHGEAQMCHAWYTASPQKDIKQLEDLISKMERYMKR